MRASVLLLMLVVAGTARADDLSDYNRALASYNQGVFDDAAVQFYRLTQEATEAEVRLKSEYYLASSLDRAGLPFIGFVYFTPVVRAGPQHPMHLEAVEAFVSLQERLGDDYLIPSIINNSYDQFDEAWRTLPLEVLARINYLIGRISHRKALLEDARSFLEAVPEGTRAYPRARYLLGITLADPRFPAADQAERRKNARAAIDILESLLRADATAPDPETRALAQLGLGRLHYNLGEYATSVEWYETVPRFSTFWDQALFENGFARFQNDDLGGGLGSLQGLYAPQFAGAFQPESWILTSTIYYFACLYEESKASLAAFDRIYQPMADALRPVVEGPARPLPEYFQLVVGEGSRNLPAAVLNSVRANERMAGLIAMVADIDREKAAIQQNQKFRAAGLAPELVSYLDQNRVTLEQVAGTLARTRFTEAFRSIRGFSDQAEIIRFEVAKAEKELAELAVNRRALLASQPLYRPKIPGEGWNFWTFQGEFWRDEIGYYQYTLKNGCPQQP